LCFVRDKKLSLSLCVSCAACWGRTRSDAALRLMGVGQMEIALAASLRKLVCSALGTIFAVDTKSDRLLECLASSQEPVRRKPRASNDQPVLKGADTGADGPDPRSRGTEQPGVWTSTGGVQAVVTGPTTAQAGDPAFVVSFTRFAEDKRRYVETFSAARRFRPHGQTGGGPGGRRPPAAIDQTNPVRSSRSRSAP
jgi:hypothetical protein